MSLLPGTILPPAMPFARIAPGKEGQPPEFMLIEQNWWLFLYNLSQNVLGTPNGGQTTGLSATALIDLASLEADADDADAVSARAALQSITLFSQDTVSPADSDIARLRVDVNTALLLAQDSLLQDPVVFPAIPQPANPTSKVGLTAVNGTAGTFMTSDSAPALSQSITPTWTGLHTFNAGLASTFVNVTGTTVPDNGLFLNSANVLSFSSNGVARGTIDTVGQWIINTPSAATAAALTITAAVGQAALRVNQGVSGPGSTLVVAGNSVAGASYGAFILGGTNASDFCAQFYNAAASGNPILKLFGNGAIQLGQVATTTAAPAAGGAGALPATPKGYMTLTVGATAQQVAYY